jgi:hypothetical protein
MAYQAGDSGNYLFVKGDATAFARFLFSKTKVIAGAEAGHLRYRKSHKVGGPKVCVDPKGKET